MQIRLALALILCAACCSGNADELPPINSDGFYVDDSLLVQYKRGMEMARSKSNSYQEACYSTDWGDLGCFSTAPPFSAFGRLALIPKSPAMMDVSFSLYSRETDAVKLIIGDSTGLAKTHFDGTRQTKIVVHGFLDWGTSPWHKEMVAQLLASPDNSNVIVVDWHKGSQTTYAQASANTRVVGALIAQLIDFLSKSAKTDSSKFHILGHSLGSHIAGYAGERTPGLGRITGMDPAGPYFENMDPVVRLTEGDATFVDVIHTDGASPWSILTLDGGFGLFQPSGHVDVYANGGIKQPGCGEKGPIMALIKDGIFNGTLYTFACNHMRVWDYASETVNSKCPYRSYACANYDEFKTGNCLRTACSDPSNTKACNSVGYKAVPVNDGSVHNAFYMTTGAKTPYCRYHFQVELTLSTKKTKDEKGFAHIKLAGDKFTTDWIRLGDETVTFKAGTTYRHLIATSEEMTDVKAVTFKWEKDASIIDVGQWEVGTPEIFVKKLNVFSGEFRYERQFCDADSSKDESVKSKKQEKTFPARSSC